MLDNVTLGLDIGIGSVGWSLIDQSTPKLIDMGVRIFDSAEAAEDKRLNRSARRTQTRKKWRESQLLLAFNDFGILSKEETSQEDYLSYTVSNDNFTKPEAETVYHLRKKGLNEKLSKRELLLSLYNICKTRGHFLLETVDFESVGQSVDEQLFSNKFFDMISDCIVFETEEGKDHFNELVLKRIFAGDIRANEIKTIFRKENFTTNNEVGLQQLILLLAGNTVKDLTLIDGESFYISNDEQKTKGTIRDLQNADSMTPLLEDVLGLYNILEVSKVLNGGYNYICEYDVDLLEKSKEMANIKKTDPEKYQELKKEVQSKMNGTRVSKHPDSMRYIKNMDNKFPNGLYVKEARAILKKQQEFDPAITDEFIDVCISVIKSRIPYYVGPLSENATNGWVVKNGNIKYSYEYSKDVIDIDATIKKWKDRMRSRCTYFPEEFALPKGSFIAETFSLVNELNILTALDQNGDTYYLTQEDKIKVFDQLFLLRGRSVKYDEVAKLLGLKSFDTKSKTGGSFKNSYTLYPRIASILPDLRVNSIMEIFTDKEKISKIEEIVLDVNLYNEDKVKIDHFKKDYDDKTAHQLARLKSNSYYAFSEKLINGVHVTPECTLLEKLFDDNSSDYANEQMTLLTNAVDENGNKVDYSSNKYLEIFKKNPELNVNVLMKDGKPIVPMSRVVIRSLNECFKIYKAIIDTYGVPSRVVIETARELTDNLKKAAPKKHIDILHDLYKDIQKQLKETKKKEGLMPVNHLEEWDVIEQFYKQNRDKIELYIRQLGKDMISGDPIDIYHLENYEIDHIVPRGFGMDDLDNKMLIKKEYNARKADRVPLQYIEQDEVKNEAGKLITKSNFVNRVKRLHDINKTISDRKQEMLLLESTKEIEGFIQRNLVDTRYITRELMSILNAYNKVKGYDVHLVSLRAAFTNAYKRAFGIRKNRDIGDQHHAYDASIIAIADEILSKYYPHYDERGNFENYQNFLKKLNISHDLSEEEKRKMKHQLNAFIRSMYFVTYHQDYRDSSSLLNKIEETTPLYSVKCEKNYKGAFFDATIYSPKRVKVGPLNYLKINNDKHAFDSVKCVAVDFYKVTEKDGKKRYCAVHIPKVIIDKYGKINQEQYITLIRDYYKYNELLDADGNLITGYFQMRLFKHDLFYDTKNKIIQSFNLGSMKDNNIETHFISINSYWSIYKYFDQYKNDIVKHFNIGYKDDQILFKDVDKKELIEYCYKNFASELFEDGKLDFKKYVKTSTKVLKNAKNVYEFVERFIYLHHLISRNLPFISTRDNFERNRRTANKITDDPDARYVKIKYSPLGIRYYKRDGVLHISGPHGHENMYSLIKKEKFSWKICKDMS